MKENPKKAVEIAGHTDSKGSDALNMALSEARAKSVSDYLQAKGIPSKQLLPKGYGKTMPVASNTLPNGKPDLAGMQLNRRVEIKLLDIN